MAFTSTITSTRTRRRTRTARSSRSPTTTLGQTYQKAGGKLKRDDWRRDAVNRFVERMYREVKNDEAVGEGRHQPVRHLAAGPPAGDRRASTSSRELYADAKLWLNEGWVDYFTPQLYWPIAQEKQSYPKLLEWWAGENTKKRHLWPGNIPEPGDRQGEGLAGQRDQRPDSGDASPGRGRRGTFISA